MAGRSLRAHLLRMLLPPIAAALALGALVSYYPTIEPATNAYDQALVDKLSRLSVVQAVRLDWASMP